MKNSILSMCVLSYKRGSWPRYIGSFSTVAGIMKLAYRFDRLGSIREERNVWYVLVLSENLEKSGFEVSLELLTIE